VQDARDLKDCFKDYHPGPGFGWANLEELVIKVLSIGKDEKINSFHPMK